MADGSVAALALAHRRVVMTRDRIERHQDVRSYLLRIGAAAAAARLTSLLRDLDIDLADRETNLRTAAAQVHQDFDEMVMRAEQRLAGLPDALPPLPAANG
jgi:hypothetical protein